MSKLAKIFIIILSWNGKDDTLTCLASLSKINQDGIKAHIVVVDNGSSDGSARVIKKQFPQVILCQNKTNLGFGAGANQGAKFALDNGADFLLFLNNDTTVEKDFLIKLWEFCVACQKEVVSPYIYYHNSRQLWYCGGRVVWPIARIEPIKCSMRDNFYPAELLSACCLLVSKKAWQMVGEFDERYFFGLEDADWCLRAKQKGISLWVNPRSKIWHKVSASVGGKNSPLAIYYLLRNNLIFIKDYYPAYFALPYLYVLLLGAKIATKMPQVAIIKAIWWAWTDFFGGKSSSFRHDFNE
ncbi:glycosyltransferase family 2 protein [Candidatus Daviesbacteria bacterium]|nr:glycosyltransferase family 2 protein [Candidatus Daviesbacteria bacterium]